MKLLITTIILTLLFSCDSGSGSEIDPKTMASIIEEIDKLAVPIEEKTLKDYYPESVEGDHLITIKNLDKLIFLKAGYRSSLIGTKDKPVAVILYVNATLDFYLIPFQKVSRLDRPRRLTKLGGRFYRIESNRSASGVYGDKVE